MSGNSKVLLLGLTSFGFRETLWGPRESESPISLPRPRGLDSNPLRSQVIRASPGWGSAGGRLARVGGWLGGAARGSGSPGASGLFRPGSR